MTSGHSSAAAQRVLVVAGTRFLMFLARYFPLTRSTTGANALNRRMRALDGLGESMEPVDSVVLTGEGQRPFGEEPFQHLDGLGQPADADARRVEGHSGLLVLGSQKPRSEAELEAPSGKKVERRDFLRQDHRVSVVVVDDGCCGIPCSSVGQRPALPR